VHVVVAFLDGAHDGCLSWSDDVGGACLECVELSGADGAESGAVVAFEDLEGEPSGEELALMTLMVRTSAWSAVKPASTKAS